MELNGPIWLSDSDIGDYDYELSLEMKRQKIQRELMKLEQENLEKREEIVVKKDETPTKTRVTAVPKVSDQFLCWFLKYQANLIKLVYIITY